MRYTIQNPMTGQSWDAPGWEAAFWAAIGHNVYRRGGSCILLLPFDIIGDIHAI
jgi:hypothetical protein